MALSQRVHEQHGRPVTMGSRTRRIMLMAAIVNIGMWIGAIFLESKHSLALITTTLIITGVGVVFTIWNSAGKPHDHLPSSGGNLANDRMIDSPLVNEPLPDPMDYDIEMPFS